MKTTQDKYWDNVTKGKQSMLSARVRQYIYAFTTISVPIMAYLNTEGKIDTFWFGLFSVAVSAVTALAFSKVTPDEEL